MKSIQFNSFRKILTGAVLLLLIPLAHAMGPGGQTGDFIVTRHFTGAWDQVDHESQGILLEVIEQADDSRRAVAYWYTYGSDRKSAWYLGIGDLVENRVEFELFESDDVGFMEPTRSEPDSVQSIGSLSITFESCDFGTVTFATGHEEVGSGSFDITRVSEVMNTHCSGGISDDMHSDASFGEQYLALSPAREGVEGSGRARFESYPGYMAFEVEVEDLPDGVYHLYAGMQDRGEFGVQEGRGELRFRSPGETGTLMMTFDPRGMQVEIHDDTGVVLSSFENRFSEDEHGHYGEEGHGHNYDCDRMPGMGGGMRDCVDDGDYVEIEVELVNTGVLTDAEGEAEWKMTTEHVEFSVEIEDVPTGAYALNIGGVEVGRFEAFERRFGDVYGHIRFRDPAFYGRQPLDFEPRGQKIEVLSDNIVILEVNFPES